uniref:Uncharacterized protein n=1 Tax=Romanomermis culicivorax TaxID=13658 RepID=A0A915KPC0_ROMCU
MSQYRDSQTSEVSEQIPKITNFQKSYLKNRRMKPRFDTCRRFFPQEEQTRCGPGSVGYHRCNEDE